MRSASEILKIFKENNITGYKIEKDLNISQVGADKFLKGETKKPFRSTLKVYNSYINNGFQPIENEVSQLSNSLQKDIIRIGNETVVVDDIVDLFLLHIDNFKRNPKFKLFLNNEKNKAIIEYQNKMLEAYKRKE